ncbi:MAG: hypothetical protein IJ388_04460 [Oscillospiraceae bacterium]|nr:hypothetical protein [Oscillospiraceae bacterium]
MSEIVFKHREADDCHDVTLTLHDCIADKVNFSDNILRFYLPDGIWITPLHKDNKLSKTVRTDAAIVDFRITNFDDIILYVYTRGVFKRTQAKICKMHDLMRDINSGKYSFEFISQYRSHFEQMWHCAIHSKKKPYYMECQLHLPAAEAIFHWNNLRPDQQW